MKVQSFGETVPLARSLNTDPDEGKTGMPTLQLLGEQVGLSRAPVSDFRSGVNEGMKELLGERAPISRSPVAPYEGATLSTRASKQQGSGR